MKASQGHLGSSAAAIAAVVTMAVFGTMPATADTANVCMQTNYSDHGLGQTLNCTANDVRVARATNINIISGGECHVDAVTGLRVCTCIGGGNVTFEADFEVRLTAQTRYDVGVYFSTDGDRAPGAGDGALTGQCQLIDLDQENAPATFIQLDQNEGQLECGDIDSAHNPQVIQAPLTVACQAGAGGKLSLPNCTSWRQPGSNALCTGATDAFPGSPSKCHCDTGFTIDITVEHPVLGVTKGANPTAVDEPGGPVTFTLKVTNPAEVASVTLTELVDDPDNNPGTANSTTYAPIATYCTPTTLGPGASATCTFTRTVSGNAGDSFTDKACVSGIDSNGGAVGPACDTATVSIRDVKPTAAVTKTVDALVCGTVKFKVKVENTDTAEALTLSSLSDDLFGNIATPGALGGKVVKTTCVVPQTIASSDKYECAFEAMICSFPSTDTVTGTLSDNDSNTITPSGTATVHGIQFTPAP